MSSLANELQKYHELKLLIKNLKRKPRKITKLGQKTQKIEISPLKNNVRKLMKNPQPIFFGLVKKITKKRESHK